MDRSKVNTLLVERRKEIPKTFRQLGIHLGYFTVIPDCYAGQDAIMHSGPLDRRYPIKRGNRNGWYIERFDTPNISLEAFGMRKDAGRGQ